MALAVGLHPVAVWASDEAYRKCIIREVNEDLGNKILPVKHVTRVRIRDNKVRIENVLGTRSRLVFGVTTHHAYLYIDGVRFDGNALFAAAGIKTDTSLLDGGYWFVFDKIDPASLEKLRRSVNRMSPFPPYTSSCVAGACGILQEHLGISVAGRGTLSFPSDILSKIFKNGFVDSEGKAVPITVYKVGNHTFREIHGSIKTAETEVLIVVAFVGAGTMAGTGIIIGRIQSKPAERQSAEPQPSATPTDKN